MSTRDYLDQLTYDQLAFARRYATQRLQDLDAEPKIALWIVSEGPTNYAAFPDYQAGLDYIARRLTDQFGLQQTCDLEIGLKRHLFRESEVSEMLSLEKP